jgi:hypothetical protein
MTFHSTVAVNRSYDLAFSGTNPQRLRLMMPHGSGETRVAELTRGEAVHACIVHLLTCGIHLSLFMHTRIHAARLVVSIFYSNPEKLEVLWNGRLVPPLEMHMTSANSYNFSMRKPAVSDPCGSNAFAGWENKVYVVVCGGTQGVEIVQVKKIVLSIGIELAVEDFFDPHCPGGQKWPKKRHASGAPHSTAASAVRPPKLQQPNNAGYGGDVSLSPLRPRHYLVRNLASLFGIPASRMRVPKIVPGSTRRRRLAGASDGGTAIDVEILAEDACSADDTCGPHGSCYAGGCTCDEGWEHAPNCAEGDCLCSRPVSGGACPPKCEHCDATGVCLTCADEAPVRHSGNLLYLGCTPICGLQPEVPILQPFVPKLHASVQVANYICVQVRHSGKCGLSCPAGHAIVTALLGGNATCAACHESCGGECLGPAPDQCTRCDDVGAHAYLLGGACLLHCPEGHYADGARVCRPCAARCKTCSGPRATQCTSCTPNACSQRGGCPRTVFASLDMLGSCVSRCPHGQYTDPFGACAKCDAACQLCSGPNHTQCVDPTPNTPFGDSDCAAGARRRGGQSTCVAVCAEGHYALSSGHCAPCEVYDCAACTAAAPRVCLACRAAPWLNPVLTSGVCGPSCLPQQYARLDGTSTCGACDPTCSSCDGPESQACTACDPAGTTPLLIGGACLAACPDGSAADPNVAVAVCAPCDGTCSKCTTPTDPAACVACASPGLLLPAGGGPGACAATCPVGEYGALALGACAACAPNCARCRGPDACTECSAGFGLREGRCVAASATARKTEADTTAALFGLANATRSKALEGSLDTGYTIVAMALQAAHGRMCPVYKHMHAWQDPPCPCSHHSLRNIWHYTLNVCVLLYPHADADSPHGRG